MTITRKFRIPSIELALALALAGCVSEPEDAGPTATGVVALLPEPDGPETSPDDRLALLRGAPLVAVARVAHTRRTVETVTKNGRPEEREFIVADVVFSKVLHGADPQSIIANSAGTVTTRDTSESAPLREGREVLLSLSPRPDGTLWVRASHAVRDGEVPSLGRSVDSVAAWLEVDHAR